MDRQTIVTKLEIKNNRNQICVDECTWINKIYFAYTCTLSCTCKKWYIRNIGVYILTLNAITLTIIDMDLHLKHKSELYVCIYCQDAVIGHWSSRFMLILLLCFVKQIVGWIANRFIANIDMCLWAISRSYLFYLYDPGSSNRTYICLLVSCSASGIGVLSGKKKQISVNARCPE